MLEHVHDTWISDHTFVTWFVVAATFFMVAAMVFRCIAFGGRRTPGDVTDALQTAFLAGGPQLAVYAALGKLWSAGAVGVDSGEALIRIGPVPVDATPLERAVYEATAGGDAAARLLSDPAVSSTLARIRGDLEQAGLLLSPSQRAPGRWFVYAQLAVLTTGVVRVAADLVEGAPVGDLLGAFVIVGIFLLFMASVPTRTRAGATALAELRRQHADLVPPRKPSRRGRRRDHEIKRAADPGAAALGIALFGHESLYALDPVFASAVGAPLPLRTVNVIGG